MKSRIRFLTATALFDGHDASINIMRRVLQSEGAEVIHLGHDRSVEDVARAAIQEDVQGIAVSSYQGGHLEYYTFLVETLRAQGAGHIRVYGGGGGVIVPAEIVELHRRGVAHIFSPEEGQRLGLEGMIRLMLSECESAKNSRVETFTESALMSQHADLARRISAIENATEQDFTTATNTQIQHSHSLQKVCPVVGFTGTGGAGKSSLLDEVLLRCLESFPEKNIAVLCVDPTRRRTGGALLGDRIRVNAAGISSRVFFRSMATRRSDASLGNAVKEVLVLLQKCGFDLVFLETAGIGQSDSAVVQMVDIPVYIMTPEFGAPTQLEKIDMLDYAEIIAINKFDKAGSLDALRDVRKVYQRNRKLFDQPLEIMPVFGTMAHRFQDPGSNAFFNALMAMVAKKDLPTRWEFTPYATQISSKTSFIPVERRDYLQKIVASVRNYHANTKTQTLQFATADHYYHALQGLGEFTPAKAQPFSHSELTQGTPSYKELRNRYNEILGFVDKDCLSELQNFEKLKQQYLSENQSYSIRDKTIQVNNYSTSLSQSKIPKVSLPNSEAWAEQIEFIRTENVPGRFPFTAGVFPFKRLEEDPTRMFAGEGLAERTNARFHYVSQGQSAIRLSTAFDSVTLYGSDPDIRPDIYGKIGNAGVSICCLDDAKRLYSGFDLCAANTSVSMTINGPAPMILAYFFNAAIDAACERWFKKQGLWLEVQTRIHQWFQERGVNQPVYRAEILPFGHDGTGLGFLGLTADCVIPSEAYLRIKSEVLAAIRGTVQADILKEDQAQNTCIFSTEFALRMMGDVQQYFIDQNIRNFYSVSISGYHIAEAGANPITQLALTLANGFTFVEYYRARGMAINEFAPNLSFFFSNGLDSEYAVLGRVARRIWSIAMKDLYEADERSQKLKYHIQTSGRSLHAQEIDFNDIRTTLQALMAVGDNCNSLHTNAFDEAITTPTQASVRRAMAIQLIINRELGMSKNENFLQGSYFISQLTQLVEMEVLKIFEELNTRGGVLGAMEVNYQRSRIQEESMLYEKRKLSGELPIVGVNTFTQTVTESSESPELIRSSDSEKQAQIIQVKELHARFANQSKTSLQKVKSIATDGGYLFSELMEAAKVCTLGEISSALYQVGGAYRRTS